MYNLPKINNAIREIVCPEHNKTDNTATVVMMDGGVTLNCNVCCDTLENLMLNKISDMIAEQTADDLINKLLQ